MVVYMLVPSISHDYHIPMINLSHYCTFYCLGFQSFQFFFGGGFQWCFIDLSTFCFIRMEVPKPFVRPIFFKPVLGYTPKYGQPSGTCYLHWLWISQWCSPTFPWLFPPRRTTRASNLKRSRTGPASMLRKGTAAFNEAFLLGKATRKAQIFGGYKSGIKVNVPMFHITLLKKMGIFDIQQIWLFWWCVSQIPKKGHFTNPCK